MQLSRVAVDGPCVGCQGRHVVTLLGLAARHGRTCCVFVSGTVVDASSVHTSEVSFQPLLGQGHDVQLTCIYAAFAKSAHRAMCTTIGRQ